MNVRRSAQPLIEIPEAGQDRPSWAKVGVVAAIGFVIGVAWPRIAGVHFGPSVPVEGASSTASVSPSAAPGPAAPAQSAVVSAPSAVPTLPSAEPAAAAAPPPQLPPAVTANRGIVLTCKTEEGEAKKGAAACGGVAGFDAIAQPRLKKLASCPAAMGATGKLSVVFNIDFPLNKVAVEIGKSSTVPNVDAFAACVKPAFQGVSIGALDHQNPRYALFYSVAFAPRDAKVAANGGATASASSTAGPSTGASTSNASPSSTVGADEGSAQVVWEVAIVRDNPRTGQVLARLQRGTKVRLGQGQDGWYRVKYGADFSSEGWVYRGAIGR